MLADDPNPPEVKPAQQGDSQVAQPSPEAPAQAEQAERRKFTRYAVTASAELLDIHTRTRIIGRTNDLSLGGCYIDAGNALVVGTRVRLRLMADRRVFDTPARVVSAHPGMGMGLAFMETAPDQEKVLQTWLDELGGQLASSASDEMEFTLAQQSQANGPLSTRDIVNELVGLLERKGILNQSEAQTLHRKLSE